MGTVPDKALSIEDCSNSTANQYWFQQSAWTSNSPSVQLSHPLCKILTLLGFTYFCAGKIKAWTHNNK